MEYMAAASATAVLCPSPEEADVRLMRYYKGDSSWEEGKNSFPVRALCGLQYLHVMDE